MKTVQKILLIVAALGLLAAAGCKQQPLDLSMQRNRIFVMGRLLAGQTCDMRFIWRKAPGDPAPVAVTADLSQIGGDAEQQFMPTDNNTALWRWSGQVAPDASGEKTVTVTAVDETGHESTVQKNIQVYTPGKAIAVATGDYDTVNLALKADGTVVAWSLKDGKKYSVPSAISDVTAIAAGRSHGLALKADGTVAAWFVYSPGSNNYQQCDVPAGLSDVVAVAASENTSMALKADGTVIVWGNCQYEVCSVPAGLSDVVAISMWSNHNLALKADGTVVDWGYLYPYTYTPEVLHELYDIVAVSAGRFADIALRADGTVVQVNTENGVVKVGLPFQLEGLTAKAIAAGWGGGAALRENGSVVVWWIAGGLAASDTTLYYVSERRTVQNIIAISNTGEENIYGTVVYFPYTLALLQDGSVTAWFDTLTMRLPLDVPEELR